MALHMALKNSVKTSNFFLKLHSSNVKILQSASICICSHLENSHRTDIVRTNRSVYPRTYPVTLVQSDGSTTTIRYAEPRKIIKLPLDLEKVSATVKEERLRLRRPKQKLIIQEDVDVDFNVEDYEDLWKK
ncbi:unnamed protein product [Dimorphilus gyrociliatus]|uniref:Uncharacterized protein n=1 Tax=Dimorphilus gyrociliatus TaxID=2664684 RepID=A0A7I8V509_9ANNE|nr:unnamed protein product [Dimorphilus gyrociliatus]